MATVLNTYQPDYAVPPGWVLDERLEMLGISHAEFARRCGRSPKLVSDIIAGKAPVEPETALQFEKVLGVDAGIWLGIEADYRLHQARKVRANAAAQLVEWSRSFPIDELVNRGAMEWPTGEADAVDKVLAFFGVASPDAWCLRYGGTNVAYRHSPSFKSSDESLATWLRLGERDAEGRACAPFNQARFKAALTAIRSLTREAPDVFLPEMRRLCADAGVVFAAIKPLSGTALSGAARWLTPHKALIQVSLRHKTDDHFWFTVFHEAAHLLLHSKKDVFVDAGERDATDLEAEADAWAAHFLVPPDRWEDFKLARPRSYAVVSAFAEELGIAPGIVVGMLQHDGVVPYTHLNKLKRRFRWVER